MEFSWKDQCGMSTEMPALEVRGLHKKYPRGLLGRGAYHALRGVDLKVFHGEVFGLLGPNGAGKTTLIKVLLGIVRRSQGQAEVLGQPAGSRQARRLIGYLPENMSFPHHHTAISALQLYGRLSSVPEGEIRNRSAELLEMVGLHGRERELVKRYSKGMRQRLALAQALLHEPQLLIMDEPTDGLDPIGRAEMRALIVQLKQQGKTVFLNSHILQEVELVCDRVAIMSSGIVRGVGTPSELTRQFHSQDDYVVRLELIGELNSIRSAVETLCPDATMWRLSPLPNGEVQVVWKALRQNDLDVLIDMLRLRKVSIRRVEPSQLSLEEVFLTAVQSTQ